MNWISYKRNIISEMEKGQCSERNCLPGQVILFLVGFVLRKAHFWGPQTPFDGFLMAMVIMRHGSSLIKHQIFPTSSYWKRNGSLNLRSKFQKIDVTVQSGLAFRKGPGWAHVVPPQYWSWSPRQQSTELQNSKISNIINLQHDLQSAEGLS